MARPTTIAKWFGVVLFALVAASWALTATRYLHIRVPNAGMLVSGNGFLGYHVARLSADWDAGFLPQRGDPNAWRQDWPIFFTPDCYCVAHWLLLFLLGLPTALWFIRDRRRRTWIVGKTKLQILHADRHGRRMIAKWSGIGFCAAVLGFWFFCLTYNMVWQPNLYTTVWFFPSYVQVQRFDTPLNRNYHPPHFTIKPNRYGPTGNWRPMQYKRIGFVFPKPQIFPRTPTRSGFAFNIPYWLPLLIVSLTTAIIFWRDRRPPPGRCRVCRYDLTGNVSGVCSECGTTIAPTDRRAIGSFAHSSEKQPAAYPETAA